MASKCRGNMEAHDGKGTEAPNSYPSKTFLQLWNHHAVCFQMITLLRKTESVGKRSRYAIRNYKGKEHKKVSSASVNLEMDAVKCCVSVSQYLRGSCCGKGTSHSHRQVPFPRHVLGTVNKKKLHVFLAMWNKHMFPYDIRCSQYIFKGTRAKELFSIDFNVNLLLTHEASTLTMTEHSWKAWNVDFWKLPI